MNRSQLRVAALSLSLYLAVSPVALAAPKRDRVAVDPGDQIVRIIKKVVKAFRLGSQEDLPAPPIPKP
jgi:hypothetical protein